MVGIGFKGVGLSFVWSAVTRRRFMGRSDSRLLYPFPSACSRGMFLEKRCHASALQIKLARVGLATAAANRDSTGE